VMPPRSPGETRRLILRSSASPAAYHCGTSEIAPASVVIMFVVGLINFERLTRKKRNILISNLIKLIMSISKI
jgi:hypothetical protein